MQLQAELELALELIQRCGEVARRIQAGGEQSLQTSTKHEDQSPVTLADITVESMILDALHEHFPDDAVLAEESAALSSWQGHARVWMIDPVDGTKDFAEGDSSWAVHIGLAIDGSPALGVVYEPGHERLSWALDHGSERLFRYREGRGGEVVDGLARAQPPEPRYRLITSKSHRSAHLDTLMRELGIQPEQTLRTASTGVKLAMIARGEAELYAHPTQGTELWDSCAPQVLLHAAGGRLTDMRGAPLAYAGPELHNLLGLLATPPGSEHPRLVETLRPLVSEWFPD